MTKAGRVGVGGGGERSNGGLTQVKRGNPYILGCFWIRYAGKSDIAGRDYFGGGSSQPGPLLDEQITLQKSQTQEVRITMSLGTPIGPKSTTAATAAEF